MLIVCGVRKNGGLKTFFLASRGINVLLLYCQQCELCLFHVMFGIKEVASFF